MKANKQTKPTDNLFDLSPVVRTRDLGPEPEEEKKKFVCDCPLIESDTMIDFGGENFKGERMFYCRTHSCHRSKPTERTEP